LEVSTPGLGPPDLGEVFRAHERFLFGLSYRLTGSADDARDVVQETFARAIEHPPARTDEPWRPWLARVAVNLSVDTLRRRRRRPYVGPWLPQPLGGGEDTEPPSFSAGRAEGSGAALEDRFRETPEARYELLESVSFAFLMALEVLTPKQRAALILHDVFDYSALEVGQCIGASEGHARVLLHRARRAMRGYDRARSRPTPELRERTRRTLEELVRCLLNQDVAALERLLSEDVRTVTDADGEYTALHEPLEGRARVMRLYLQVAQRRAAGARMELRLVNGLPALLVRFEKTLRRQAPRLLLRCELDPKGRIREIHAILATRKLAAIDGVLP
jgi:RNA polymerase sigma-70 factor (ECF subfamily)